MIDGPEERTEVYRLGPAEVHRLVDESGWPPALAKASVDEFDYAAQIRDVGIVLFSLAEPAGRGWVRLYGPSDGHGGYAFSCTDKSQAIPFPCSRGIEVRLSDIVWVADCPEGT